MNTKPTAAALAVASVTPAPRHEINHEADAQMRRIIARDNGITGNRAALQRRMEAAGKPENAHQRKQRLIARGTARLIEMGFTMREAKRIARESYNLARKDTDK